MTPEFVIGSYHRLFKIEKPFRMSKHDLQARPAYHHLRDSIEAYVTIVFAGGHCAAAESKLQREPERALASSTLN